jgi:hypothetical protein
MAPSSLGKQFRGANFQGEADFSGADFEEANFWNSEFYGKIYLSGHFNGTTKFNYVLFEGKEKIYFDIENLSNVSFMNTDITGVRFSDEARRRIGGEGGKKVKGVNTDISTQLKDELQVTVLVLIYEQLLPLLLFCLWKDQMAYSVLFRLTIKIWM